MGQHDHSFFGHDQGTARVSRADELIALKSHDIFVLAASRPLLPAEVDIYLAVKVKIAKFELLASQSAEPDAPSPSANSVAKTFRPMAKAAAVPSQSHQRSGRSTAFDL